MIESAPFHTMTAARLATFAVALLTAATVGCKDASDPSIRTDFATLRSIHSDTGADAVGALDATAPPANLSDYRHPTRYKVNAAYHPQPH